MAIPRHKYDHPNWTDAEWDRTAPEDKPCPVSMQAMRCRPGGLRCCSTHYYGCPGMSRGDWRETWVDMVAVLHPNADASLIDEEPWSEEFYNIVLNGTSESDSRDASQKSLKK